MRWDVLPLGELAASADGAIAIGPFGSAMKADTYTETGVPVVRGTNISDTRAWKGDWVFIPEKLADSMNRCVVFAGDLVLPHRGSIGEVAIIPDDERGRYFISSSLMKITLDRQKVDPLFCYYFLRSAEGRVEILRFSSSVGTPGIGQPLTSLRQFRVPVPPLPEQRAIAATLGALDDKIELNRRMNATLESMARALFRDWFVDFGPTRAKAAGTAPGAQSETAPRDPWLAPDLWSLFPDRLDKDGKPEGWRAATLADVAVARNQGVIPSEVDDDTPYIGLEHMPRGSIALADWEGAGKVSSNKAAFKAGDFLFGKLRPYFHKVGIAAVSGICSTDIVVLRPKDDHWSGFVIACISDADFVAYTDKTSTGTKMPRTSWSIMSKYPLVLPPPALAEAFNAAVAPMLARIRANIHESRTLVRTRDLLLPRLMSGELRVPDAERMVEAAQ